MQAIPQTRQTLGVQWARSPRREYRPTGFLRRWTPIDVPASRYLDWTVDGEAIGDWFAAEDDPRFETTWLNETDRDVKMIEGSLRALLGERTRWHREVAFDEGRVALLFCAQCGDLGCGAITADVAFTTNTAEWRDIAREDGAIGGLFPDPPPRTVVFERSQYEATIRTLLADWTKRA